jgi:autotransporter-associated beta strand protein
MSGTGLLSKTNSGTLTLSGANTYSGGTTVNQGTLLVATNGSIASSSLATVNGGLLQVNGTAGAVTVNRGGGLGGTGTVGAVTLKDGSFLKPGNSPGLLTALSATWEAGSTYNWEIDNADGTAGINWDLFSVTGALDLSDLSSSKKMNLVLASLSTVTNFSATTPDSWVFAQAGSLVGNAFTAGADVTDLFNINATAFNNGTVPANGWRVEVGDTGKTLNLMAVPEPSTGSMFGLGLAGLVVTRLLRRKNS